MRKSRKNTENPAEMPKNDRKRKPRQPRKWLVVRFQGHGISPYGALGAMKYPEQGRPRDMGIIPDIRAYRIVEAYSNRHALSEGDKII